MFQLEPNGDLQPLDSETAVRPSIGGTWFCSLVVSLYRRVVPVKEEAPEGEDTVSTEEEGSVSAGSGTVTPVEGGGRTSASATVMAGGRRRKAVRKK